MVDVVDEEKIDVKLADFGIAKRLKPGKHLTRVCGSLVSMAPEILRGEGYNHKVDNWALGVILYELLS